MSLTKIPSGDILESLYKLRTRESEKLKTVLELYNMEIHQKKTGPDYHRLKTMVKRSIEQDIRINSFGARNGNYERNAVVKNQGTKQREQRTLGECWQWKANGQCSKGDNCGFRHDINKRGKVTPVTPSNPSPSSSTRQNERKCIENPKSQRQRVPVERMFRLPCKDYLTGTCTTPSVKNGILQNACSTRPRVGADLGKGALMHTARLMNSPARGLKNGDKSAVAMLKSTRQLGCVFQDMEPPKSSSIPRKSPYIRKPDVFNSLKPSYVMQTFETKILRSEWFAQVNLISVAPTLQNLRIGLRKRDKSKVPANKRGCSMSAN